MKSNTINRPSLTVGRILKTIGALSCVALVAACGSSGAVSRSNPNFFSGDVNDKTGAMTGFYNPVGYNEKQVRKLVTETCESGRLSSFAEAQAEDLRTYTATCQGGFDSTVGFVEFERTETGNVLIETLGSDGSGNLSFIQKEVAL